MSDRMFFRLFTKASDTAARLIQPALTRVALRQAHDIQLERQRRALATTVDFVEKNMPHLEPATSGRSELISAAFKRANLSDDRLVCEFGVFEGQSINQIASLTSKTVFGFDSFQGLPEQWGTVEKGTFRVTKLPTVEKNVELIQGW